MTEYKIPLEEFDNPNVRAATVKVIPLQKPKFRCPVHGDNVPWISINLPKEEYPKWPVDEYYCLICWREMMLKNCQVLEEI